MEQSRLCEHFLQGKCSRGDRCRFSHAPDGGLKAIRSDAPDAAAVGEAGAVPKKVCQHYLQGKCTRGERCRFLHVAPESGSGAPDLRSKDDGAASGVKICQHFLAGKCTRGERCRFSHAKTSTSDAKESNVTRGGTAAKICSHFLRGTCSRGSACRFSHEAGNPPKEPGEKNRTRRREGLQARKKKRDWMVYGAKLDNVLGIVPDESAPVCRGHGVPCARRRVTKPSARRYGDEYWVCSKVVCGRPKESCGHFTWVQRAEAVPAKRRKL